MVEMIIFSKTIYLCIEVNKRKIKKQKYCIFVIKSVKRVKLVYPISQKDKNSTGDGPIVVSVVHVYTKSFGEGGKSSKLSKTGFNYRWTLESCTNMNLFPNNGYINQSLVLLYYDLIPFGIQVTLRGIFSVFFFFFPMSLRLFSDQISSLVLILLRTCCSSRLLTMLWFSISSLCSTKEKVS